MTTQKYSVNQHPIQTLLTYIESGEIAIPEIQRPFVWSATKVRDFIDSLYQGFPVGYLISWRNPNVRLKDGTVSNGKRILIDGQQRVTALMAAILGKYVVNKDYQRVKIAIAFNPKERRFEVSNPFICKDQIWIPDISRVLSPDVKMLKLVNEYCTKNPDCDQDDIFSSMEQLHGIVFNHIGLIDLNSDLDIETVTEIFIRINREGVVLSQADFAMSKIAVNEKYGGNLLRKCIDYFCHLAVSPEFYPILINHDKEFASTEYFRKMSWLKSENDDLYDPSYTDMLRVAFISEFNRGRLEDLVALLSGRNFETRSYEEEISENSFKKLETGILNFMNENNFKFFIMILRSAGFIDPSMIRSQNVINFSYAVFLVLKSQKIESRLIEKYVRKWFVLSILTGRYSGSPESAFDFDIKQIINRGFAQYLSDVETAELSDAFWEAGLPQGMNTSVSSSPFFNVYLASQVKTSDRGFLSKDITVSDLISHKGDVHHIFPSNYLKKNGLARGQYNQIANYVMMQSEINIAIGDKEPALYFSQLFDQCIDKKPKYGAIVDLDQLEENLSMHCIPSGMEKMTVDNYNQFLEKRRKLISKKIRNYYQML